MARPKGSVNKVKTTQEQKIEPVAAQASLEDRIAELEATIDHYKSLAERSFEKTRELENQLDSVETFYRKRLKFIDETIATLRATVTMAVKGDL